MKEAKETKWCESCQTEDHTAEAHTVPSTEDTPQRTDVACCAVHCAETHRMVTEIHAAFMGLAGAMTTMAENPMLRAMGRQFGIDPGAIAQSMKG